MTTKEFIEWYFKNCWEAVDALKRQEEQIEKAVNVLFAAWRRNSPVYILGNGGSASTASHLAADLAKTINDRPGCRGIRAFTFWDNIPHSTAVVNDRPKEDFFTAWLDTYYEKGGIGIGISVHGGSGSDFGGKWSQNLLSGMQHIKARGGATIGLSGFDGGPMAKMVDVPIVIPVAEKDLGTPLVESFHVVVHHLIIFRLKEMIKENYGA